MMRSTPSLPVHPSLLAKQQHTSNTTTLPTLQQLQSIKRRTIPDPSTLPFQTPKKEISSISDVQLWLSSEAFARLLWFIQALNLVAHQKKNTSECHETESVKAVLSLLSTLDKWIDEIPPLDQPSRFGNMAFRKWIERLEKESANLIQSVLPPALHSAVPELTAYFSTSFGNGTRIDYGSGHELHFVAFLCCLSLLDFIKEEDYLAVVIQVFNRYLILVRRLQRTYTLEPAGSHGVWGLDDHQFLPYYWGAAQLIDHPRIQPKSILNKDVVEHYGDEYLYLGCIKYINEVKKGPFFEHSPILYDISGVPNWNKVNTGMLKMFVAEVLAKFPIVQHFVFGELLPFRPMLELEVESNEETQS